MEARSRRSATRLFHAGFTAGKVFLSESFPDPVHLDTGDIVYVNAQVLVRKVKRAVLEYIAELRRDPNSQISKDFERFWDDQWGTAKAPHILTALRAHISRP